MDLEEKNQNDNPMYLLLSVYSERQDLQAAFPEVKKGFYDRLLEWAIKDGTTIDGAKGLLSEHKDWYKSQLHKEAIERGRRTKEAIERGRRTNIILLSMRIIRDEGVRSFIQKGFKKIRRKEVGISKVVPSAAYLEEAARLRPCSPEQYRLWMSLNQPSTQTLQRMRLDANRLSFRPQISICMPVYNPEQRYLSMAVESVRSQVYDNWELIIVDDGSDRPQVRALLKSFAEQDSRIRLYLKETNEGTPKTLNQAFSKAAGDYLMIMDHDDVLEPHALYELLGYLNGKGRDSDLIYSDEVLIDAEDEVFYIYFRPDFSPDFLLSHQYFVHMVAINRLLLEKVGGCDESFPNVSWDYDLYLRLAAKAAKIGHIPKVLYRWRRYENTTSNEHKELVMKQSKVAIEKGLQIMGIEATVEDGPDFNYFRVRRKLRDEKLSIIILTKNMQLLDRCIRSIKAKTKYENYEIVIVANNLDSDGKSYLEERKSDPRYRVIYYDKPFNFSAMNNYAAKLARGEHLLFLNDDTEVLAEGSVEAMLEHSQRKEVGAVGAKLLYQDNTIQHAGVIIGLLNSCEHIHKFHPANDPGYGGSLIATRNYSAVTGACIMIPRKVFERIGGFDEELSITLQDIDLCLRIRKLGYLVVYTPHAVLYHYEQLTRKNLRRIHPYSQHMFFKKRWKDLFKAGDLYFNPNLSHYHFDCRPNFVNISNQR